MAHRYLALAEARAIARRFSVSLPRVGCEVSLGDGRWLSSTGHAQFGWFGRDDVPSRAPFSVRCRCEESLRPGEPRGCTAECPARAAEAAPKKRNPRSRGARS